VHMPKKRTHSSTLWLQRHSRDPYVKQAKKEGWRARSAYKLIELNERYRVFKKKSTVLELGAAPGGWSEVLAMLVPAGHIVAVDRLPMDPIEGVVVVQKDLEDEDALDVIQEALCHKAHVIVSDAAPNTIGHPSTDHLRMMGLLEVIWQYVERFLHKGGAFVCKGWQGSEWGDFVLRMKKNFGAVHLVKPPSSQKQSRETYLVCQNFLP